MIEISTNKKLSKEEFCSLFEPLPLSGIDRHNINSIYWPLYEVCVNEPGVTPMEAWMAVKNTFITKEPQIGKRIEEQKKKKNDR